MLHPNPYKITSIKGNRIISQLYNQPESDGMYRYYKADIDPLKPGISNIKLVISSKVKLYNSDLYKLL